MRKKIFKCLVLMLIGFWLFSTITPGRAMAEESENFMSTESVRELRPFASYIAFMTGYEDGTFRSEQQITRGEAIAAMTRLLVDEEEIQEIYTSDFTDISPDSSDYYSIAYMERCDFLPDFGTVLNPNQSITRGELVDLILDKEDISQNVTVMDVSVDNALYGKVCYAVEKGMFELDSEGKFGMNVPVTRGEAAKAFCKYIGKTINDVDAVNKFSDVTQTEEYYDYILLATNSKPYMQETYTVTADGQDSIQDCIDRAIELSKTTDAVVSIELADGIHKVTEAIKIDGSAYGEHELSLIIKNAEGASPVVSGNTDIDASLFTKAEGKEYYSYQLPDTAKVNGKWPQFRDLYLNGTRLRLARSEEYTFKKTLKDQEKNENGTITGYSNWFYVDGKIFEQIDNDSISSLEICVNVEWMGKRFRVASLHGVEESTGLMQLAVEEEEWYSFIRYDGNKRSLEFRPYWFENHLILLDEPGEFYYDDENGVIYFYPYKDTDMSLATISYPLVEKLFDMNETSDITFEGLVLTGITSNYVSDHGFNGGLGNTYLWYETAGFETEEPFPNGITGHLQAAAIYGNYSDYITVKDCSFHELGANGVYFDGGNHNIILKGNSFTNLAMSAAIFGRQDLKWNLRDGQSNIIIDNNYVYNIGTDYVGSPGFEIARVKNVAFTHNTVIHTPYSGVMMGWFPRPNIMNIEVAYNRFEDNLYALNDGSAMYFMGENAPTTDTSVYNRVHDNYVKSTGYDGSYNGIYLDGSSSNFSVYGNILDGFNTAHGPIFVQDDVPSQYTHNNILRENYTTLRPIFTSAKPDRNIQLIDNQMFMRHADLPQEALDIIAASGQQDKYSGAILQTETVVEMEVEDPHITVKKQGSSDSACVTFTITNNGTETATYSVVHTNPQKVNAEFIASTDELELAAGKTGTIEISFKGGDQAIEAAQYDIAVVKDNGWKMQYRRVIEVTVSKAIAKEDNVKSETSKGNEERVSEGQTKEEGEFMHDDVTQNNYVAPYILGTMVLIVLAIVIIIISSRNRKKR